MQKRIEPTRGYGGRPTRADGVARTVGVRLSPDELAMLDVLGAHFGVRTTSATIRAALEFTIRGVCE